jgi:hypothetical protein
VRAENAKGGANPAGIQEVRCGCGCLVAKLGQSGIELKCRRCKRLALIPFEGIRDGGEFTVQL